MWHDGSIAYGAFTYAMHRMVQRVREEVHLKKRKTLPSPEELITLTKEEFRRLGISLQSPEVDGPTKWRRDEPFIVSPQDGA